MEQDASREELSEPASKSWKILAGTVLAAVLIGITAGTITSRIFFNPEPRISPFGNEALVQIAEKMTRNLPVHTGEENGLYSISAEDKLLHYHYRLTTLTKAALDSMRFDEMMHARMLSNYCSGSAFKIFRDNEISLQYSYRDPNDLLLSSISITPAGCLEDPIQQSG